MQDLEQEFDEKLNVRQAFAEIKYFEVVALVLPPELVQLTHQRNAVHCKVKYVPFGSASVLPIQAGRRNQIDMFKQTCVLLLKCVYHFAQLYSR